MGNDRALYDAIGMGEGVAVVDGEDDCKDDFAEALLVVVVAVVVVVVDGKPSLLEVSTDDEPQAVKA
jgi:hypothetical protein